MIKKSKLVLGGFTVLLLLIVGNLIAHAEAAPKVDVCHFVADTRNYIKINISENAFPAHVGHGDGSPGEPIPNMDGYIFGEDCQPLIVYSFMLSGITFEDTYADGTKDASEVDPGLSGWTIKIEIDKGPDGTLINGTATTGDGGYWEWNSPQYAFPVEAPPELTLKICEDLQGGWNQSFPVGDCYDLTFFPDLEVIPQALGPFDFGNWTTASKSGMNFEDLNADGIKDADEPGLSGWSIFVDYDDDGELDESEPSATTAADGTYTITGIKPGIWKVKEVAQAGWTCSFPDASADDGVQCWYEETFKSSDALAGNDFGNWTTATKSGVKFKDLYADGAAREEGEPGLYGWRIYVDYDDDGELDKGEPSAMTGDDGTYTITGINPGTWKVKEVAQTGWTCSYPAGCEWNGTLTSHQVDTGNDFGNQKIPVIVLPGLLASQLYNKTVSTSCPFSGNVWLGWYLNWIELVPTEDGQSTCDIQPDVTQDQFGVWNTYQTLIEELREEGYTVHFFPYDWRKDLRLTAETLDAQIKTWGYAKVYLIGHSMGGLLARTYVENPKHAAKIEKVITIGSPYLGAPILAMHMRAGIPPKYTFVSDPILFALIRNSPGIMQLLPSDAYFDRGIPFGLDYYFKHDGTPLTSLASTHEFFRTDYGMYGQQNLTLLDNAVAYHAIYDDFSQIGVDYHVISAGNKLTPLTFDEKFIIPWIFYSGETVSYMYGDDTVPINSATYLGAYNDNVHIYPPSYATTEGHQNLTSDRIVLDKIEEILAGTPTANVQRLTVMTDTPPPPYIKLFVLGSTELSVSDGTHYSGLDQDGMIINGIPGATYQPFGNQTEVVLPSDQVYTVTFKQVGDIPLQVKVSELTAPSYEGVFTVSDQVVFGDIPLSIDGLATMSLDLSTGLDSLSIAIDQDGDGQPDEVMQPSALLDAQQVKDYAPPVVTLQLEGTKDASGAYSGQVTIAIAAEDAGTGVLKVQYSLDGGLTWLDYRAPVSIQAEQVPVFYARSVDRAGNMEITRPAQMLSP